MKPPYTTLAPSKLAMHNDSRPIFKPKPKIRIIHIVEPQIINTDVENFREIVQKLTGKSAENKGIKKPRKNMESSVLSQTAHVMKNESEEMLYHEMENPNYLLSFLGEIDGFINDMNEFPVLPFSFSSSQINTTFGHEMPLC